MRTELLYHVDSYTREFESRVVAVQGAQVALERTSFYPG